MAIRGALLRRALPAVAGAAGIALVMAWLAGTFRSELSPGPAGPAALAPQGLATLSVVATTVPVVREVVGSIAAEHETAVAAQLLARVLEVRATAGRAVARGEVLVRLDDAEVRARLEQAEAALRQARDRLTRTAALEQSGAATESARVEAQNAVDAAAAREVEARAILGYAVVRAPADGVVIERACEPGDTVAPGRTLVRLYDHLQLVAVVPESLRSHLTLGQEVGVRVDALGEGECPGRVTEIVPEAQALARAFRVKVTGPCPEGLIPGMFGRMRLPIGERRELRVPLAAVRRVGQLALVLRLLEDGQLLRQFVELGEERGDEVIVLSGLEAGDRIAADAAQAAGARR